MNYWFIAAAIVITSTGLLHSILGERLVLGPLSRHTEIPRLLGSRRFMMQVLRFTWHLTTIVLLGTATIAALIARSSAGEADEAVAGLLAVTYLLCALIAVVGSHGKHFSWVLFLGSAVCMWLGRA